MAYHINQKTGNPNICKTASCKLPHFETKAEALASKGTTPEVKEVSVKKESKPKAAPKATKSTKAVKVETVVDHVPTPAVEEKPKEELEEAQEKVKLAVDEVKVKAKKAKEKAKDTTPSPKQLVKTIVENIEHLVKVAPKHPLAKKGKKLVKKFSK